MYQRTPFRRRSGLRSNWGSLRGSSRSSWSALPQAVGLAAPASLGVGTGEAYERVRELSAPLADDRPLGVDVELVAREAIMNRRLITLVDAALARA